MCQLANKTGVIAANTWALRVVANGGPVPSTATITALSNFIDALSTGGIWEKILDFSFFAPDSLIAAQTPAKITYGANLWANKNFVAGDLTVNGLQGDSLTKYLDTGINLNASPPFTGGSPTIFPGFSIYVANINGVDSTQCEAGWKMNAFDFFSSFTGTAFYDAYGTGAGRVSAANGLWQGFISGNRTTLGSSAIYKASSVVPFQLLVSTNANNTTQAIADSSLFVFANNNAGAPAQLSRKTLSFAAFHFGLTAAECQTLFNAVQALRVALGGGFV